MEAKKLRAVARGGGGADDRLRLLVWIDEEDDTPHGAAVPSWADELCQAGLGPTDTVLVVRAASACPSELARPVRVRPGCAYQCTPTTAADSYVRGRCEDGAFSHALVRTVL